MPKAAIAQLWDANQMKTIATSFTSGLKTGLSDVSTAFNTARDLKLVSHTIVAKSDALDGVADKMVNDLLACQTAFNVATDIPTYAGSTNFLWSEGIASTGWMGWKVSNADHQHRNTRQLGDESHARTPIGIA